MSLYVGAALGVLGVVLIVAGARGRGAELFSTLTGSATLGTTVSGAQPAFLPAPSTGPGSGTVLPA